MIETNRWNKIELESLSPKDLLLLMGHFCMQLTSSPWVNPFIHSVTYNSFIQSSFIYATHSYHQPFSPSVQSLSCVRFFATPWTAARQACFPVNHQLPELIQTHVHQVSDAIQPSHPHLKRRVVPFSSCLQSFPASGSFPVNQFFASGGQSIVASASASVFQWIFRIDFL